MKKELLTIYGRKPVLEVLENKDLKIYALHLSSSNKRSDILDKIISLAKKRGVEIKYHTKRELSFISKNSKQDQGVALDILHPYIYEAEEFLKKYKKFRLFAIDGVQNPQNLGLIVRSAAAGNIDGIIFAKRKSAPLISPLTIKASAGTLFKVPIIKSYNLKETLNFFKIRGTKIAILDPKGETLFSKIDEDRIIYILGNESSGVSKEIEELKSFGVKIPMKDGIESLNVAMAATIIAFCQN